MPSPANATPDPLSLTRTPRASLVDTVSRRLADEVLRSGLAPGDQLPSERELARRLRVSRIVVREALGRLVARGLVEGRPGVGTFVARLGDAAVTGPLDLYIRQHRVRRDHLFDLRRALEPAIAAAAARTADADHLAELATNLERTDAIVAEVESRDGELREEAALAFAWADLEFHQLLARSTGNPLYGLLLDPLIDRLLAVRLEGARLEGTARRAAADHRDVWRSVAARDPDGASGAMDRHLATVSGWSDRAAADERVRTDRRTVGAHEEEPA